MVATGFEPWSGKAHQHAAFLHPVFEMLRDLARECADIGEHQDRRMALQHRFDARHQVGTAWLDELGEGREGALDVVERPEERLSLLAALAREKAYPVPLRAGIEQVHGPR